MSIYNCANQINNTITSKFKRYCRAIKLHMIFRNHYSVIRISEQEMGELAMLILNMLQVNDFVDSRMLNKLGYQLDIFKNAYISKCGSTLVYLYRKPYFGEVVIAKEGNEVKHQENLNALFAAGYLVER